MPWRNLPIKVSLRGFWHEIFLKFDGLSESVMLWIDFSENHFDSSKEFSQYLVRCAWEAEHYKSYEIEGHKSVIFGNSKVTFIREREDTAFSPSFNRVMVIYGVAVSEQLVVEFLRLPYFWWYFIKTGNFPVFNFLTYKLNFGSHGKQHDGCEVRRRNPKSVQRRNIPDAGWKNPPGQWLVSHNSVRKLLLLILKGDLYWWDKKIQPPKNYHDSHSN